MYVESLQLLLVEALLSGNAVAVGIVPSVGRVRGVEVGEAVAVAVAVAVGDDNAACAVTVIATTVLTLASAWSRDSVEGVLPHALKSTPMVANVENRSTFFMFSLRFFGTFFKHQICAHAHKYRTPV